MYGNMDNTLGFLMNYDKIRKRNMYESGVSFYFFCSYIVLICNTLTILGDFNVGVVVFFCFFATGQHGSAEEMITATATPWFL